MNKPETKNSETDKYVDLNIEEEIVLDFDWPFRGLGDRITVPKPMEYKPRNERLVGSHWDEDWPTVDYSDPFTSAEREFHEKYGKEASEFFINKFYELEKPINDLIVQNDMMHDRYVGIQKRISRLHLSFLFVSVCLIFSLAIIMILTLR